MNLCTLLLLIFRVLFFTRECYGSMVSFSFSFPFSFCFSFPFSRSHLLVVTARNVYITLRRNGDTTPLFHLACRKALAWRRSCDGSLRSYAHVCKRVRVYIYARGYTYEREYTYECVCVWAYGQTCIHPITHPFDDTQMDAIYAHGIAHSSEWLQLLHSGCAGG